MIFDVIKNIHLIDLEMFDREVLAAYVVDRPEPILIETGYARGTNHLRNGIRKSGIKLEELAHAIVSHVHLDHSGGAADLMFDAERLALSHFGVQEDPQVAFDTAAERLTLFNERIPKLYNEYDTNIEATERAVRSELVNLGPYHDDVEAFGTRFQTHGFLRYHSHV